MLVDAKNRAVIDDEEGDLLFSKEKMVKEKIEMK